ncbi:MAG: hypothetical protein HYS08_01260 [Chlamydiae bacterium]|nr:hypothetical protein [Chlamydiota bacterium]
MKLYLFNPSLNRFAKTAQTDSNGKYTLEMKLDASLFALWFFEVFEPNDPMVRSTLQAVHSQLKVKTNVGGVARYENDAYHQIEKRDIQNVPGNPWFICSLWQAQHLIACVQTKEDLKEPLQILEWVTDHAFPSGILAEQVHPYTGEPLSVSPLTWSHATYVLTVFDYVERAKKLHAFKKKDIQ